MCDSRETIGSWQETQLHSNRKDRLRPPFSLPAGSVFQIQNTNHKRHSFFHI